MVTSPTTVHCDTTTFSSGPAQSGREFNDATRLLDNAGTASGSIAQGRGGNASGHGDNCHDGQQEAGERDGRPIPSFWNFAENKHGDNGNHYRFELRGTHS